MTPTFRPAGSTPLISNCSLSCSLTRTIPTPRIWSSPSRPRSPPTKVCKGEEAPEKIEAGSLDARAPRENVQGETAPAARTRGRAGQAGSPDGRGAARRARVTAGHALADRGQAGGRRPSRPGRVLAAG